MKIKELPNYLSTSLQSTVTYFLPQHPHHGPKADRNETLCCCPARKSLSCWHICAEQLLQELMGKSSVNLQFSIAMLNYQRVIPMFVNWVHGLDVIFFKVSVASSPDLLQAGNSLQKQAEVARVRFVLSWGP